MPNSEAGMISPAVSYSMHKQQGAAQVTDPNSSLLVTLAKSEKLDNKKYLLNVTTKEYLFVNPCSSGDWGKSSQVEQPLVAVKW